VQQETFWQAAVREFARRGLLLAVALFLIEVVLFFVVSSLPFFPGEQAAYTAQSNQISSQFSNATLFAQFSGIFVNNFRIALVEFVPGLGLLLFAFSLYATARILEVISISDNLPPALVVLILLLLFPHSWIELPAYAVAVAAGSYFGYALIRWQKTRWGPEIGVLLINVAIVTVMLLVAALFESVEIQVGGLLFLVTWIPFAILIAGVLLLNRKLSRIRKEMKAAQALVQ
jgi:uncharacterized membrane protein SpoIIM required for sporulation